MRTELLIFLAGKTADYTDGANFLFSWQFKVVLYVGIVVVCWIASRWGDKKQKEKKALQQNVPNTPIYNTPTAPTKPTVSYNTQQEIFLNKISPHCVVYRYPCLPQGYNYRVLFKTNDNYYRIISVPYGPKNILVQYIIEKYPENVFSPTSFFLDSECGLQDANADYNFGNIFGIGKSIFDVSFFLFKTITTNELIDFNDSSLENLRYLYELNQLSIKIAQENENDKSVLVQYFQFIGREKAEVILKMLPPKFFVLHPTIEDTLKTYY